MGAVVKYVRCLTHPGESMQLEMSAPLTTATRVHLLKMHDARGHPKDSRIAHCNDTGGGRLLVVGHETESHLRMSTHLEESEWKTHFEMVQSSEVQPTH